jgi:DNA-binding HxlR family transcriptional regulator
MASTYEKVCDRVRQKLVASARKPYDCGLGPAFEVIGGKWKASLLWHIRMHPRRFGELRRLTPGISEKMLIQQLREMQADGLIDRKDFHEVPPRVEYSITKLGASLDDALVPLANWGEKRAKAIEVPRKK